MTQTLKGVVASLQSKDQFSNKAKLSIGEKQDDPDLFTPAGGSGAWVASLGKERSTRSRSATIKEYNLKSLFIAFASFAFLNLFKFLAPLAIEKYPKTAYTFLFIVLIVGLWFSAWFFFFS